MNLQAEKIELVKLILETNNPNLLLSIRKLFKDSSKSDFWDNLPEYQQNEILQGLEEIASDDVVDYEQIINNCNFHYMTKS